VRYARDSEEKEPEKEEELTVAGGVNDAEEERDDKRGM